MARIIPELEKAYTLVQDLEMSKTSYTPKSQECKTTVPEYEHMPTRKSDKKTDDRDFFQN